MRAGAVWHIRAIASLKSVVKRIRREQCLTSQVPDFDPKNGNEAARFLLLLLLEAPGARAIDTGYVSLDNPDQTARNLREQLQDAGVQREDLAIWNVVPWYLGNETATHIRAARAGDIKPCLEYLTAVVQAIPGLRCIVLEGAAARKAHIHLSHSTTVRILSCHHPSPRAQNTNRDAAAENVAVFRAMLAGGV